MEGWILIDSQQDVSQVGVGEREYLVRRNGELICQVEVCQVEEVQIRTPGHEDKHWDVNQYGEGALTSPLSKYGHLAHRRRQSMRLNRKRGPRWYILMEVVKMEVLAQGNI